MKLFMHKNTFKIRVYSFKRDNLTLLKRTYVLFIPKYRSNSTLFCQQYSTWAFFFDRIQNITKNFERSFHAKIISL